MFEVAAEDDVDPADLPLARQCLESLFALYPGWAWTIEIPPGSNILKVKNLDCDPRGNYGMVFHKTNLSGSNIPKTMRVAGGEFLERWNMERREYRAEDTADRQLIFEKPET